MRLKACAAARRRKWQLVREVAMRMSVVSFVSMWRGSGIIRRQRALAYPQPLANRLQGSARPVARPAVSREMGPKPLPCAHGTAAC